MRQVRANFSADEVPAYAVSTASDSEQSIMQWITNTGLRVPVIVDAPSDFLCWEMPVVEEMNVYNHFLNRSESDGFLSPFPLQVIFAPDGTLAYIDREHHPTTVIEVLDAILADTVEAGRDPGMQGTP